MNPDKILQPIGIQKYLGEKGLICFIALMNMYISLSTDIYLPALPGMQIYFKTSTALASLSLSSFMFMFAAGILVWGPISDRNGRKNTLIVNFIIYIIGSVGCIFSRSIYQLILMRSLQGIATGAIIAVSTAIIKESFADKKREKILAIVQSLSGIAPVIAPILGALILKVTGWQGIFWVLIIFGIICLILTLLFIDTLKADERYRGSVLGAFGRLIAVIKSRKLLYPTLVFSLSSLPFMGYLAISSFVYEDFFGLSEQMYSYYFATNAIVTILGPILYMKLLINVNKKNLTYIFLLINSLSGIAVVLIGAKAPIYFMLSFMPLSLIVTAMRPFCSSILLEQHKGDTGSTSSVINTFMTLAGSLGMVIASGPWRNIIIGFGIQISICSLVALILWYLICRSGLRINALVKADYDEI